jgi:hypothetical protein
MAKIDQAELYALAQQVVEQAADLATVINELTQELRTATDRILKNPDNKQIDKLAAHLEGFLTIVKDTQTFVNGLDLNTPSFRLRLQSFWRGPSVLEEFYRQQFSNLQNQSREAREQLITLQKINFDLRNLG